MTASSESSHGTPQKQFRSGPWIVLALTLGTIGSAILARSFLRNPDGWNRLETVSSADTRTALAIIDDASATESERFIAASRLGSLGTEAVPELEARIHSDSPEVQQTALMALGQAGKEAHSVMPAIAELSASAEPGLLHLLIDAAIRIDADSGHTQTILRQAVQSNDETVRRKAFSVMESRTKAHDSLLSELLESPDAKLRGNAISAFCNRDGRPAAEIIRRIEAALFDGDEVVRARAYSGLDRDDLISGEVFEAIIMGPYLELYASPIYRVLLDYDERAFRDISFIADHRKRLAEILTSDRFPVNARAAAMLALGSTGYGTAQTRNFSLEHALTMLAREDVCDWARYVDQWDFQLLRLSGHCPSQELPITQFVTAFRTDSPGNPVFILEDHSVSSSDLETIAKLPGLRAIVLERCRLESGVLKSLEAAHGLWALVLRHCSLTDDDLDGLPPLPVLTHLSLYDNPVTSASAAAIARQSQLRHLSISNTQIDDRAFDELSQLRHLQSLTFEHTQFEIPSVARLQPLQFLNIFNHLSDDDVSHLCELRNLKFLGLRGWEVTDKSLSHLARLTNLQRLELVGTGITDEGFERLQSELPDCVIEFSR